MTRSFKAICGSRAWMSPAALAVIFAAALLFGAPPSLAAEKKADRTDPAELARKLQKKYDGVRTVSASFRQVVRSKALGAAHSSDGTVVLKKPGKMRWRYTSPAKDELVSDGKTVWLHQPDLKQVIEGSAAPLSTSVAVDFLVGRGEITKDFDVSVNDETARAYGLKLTPKRPLPDIASLAFEVDRATLLITKTTATDHFGNETVVELFDIRINEPVDDSIFTFKAPEGTSVIRP